MVSDAMPGSSGTVDLSNCAREPIHVPGFSQPFGVMMVMPAGKGRISQLSNNSELIFGEEPAQILGQKLSDVLDPDSAAAVNEVLRSGNWREANPLKLTIQRNQGAMQVNAVVHRYDGLDFVEMEPVASEDSHSASRSFHLVQSALLRLQQSQSIPDLWSAVVSEVQRITGYDRIMIYKFDRDEHGTVVAEQKRSHQQSFLGLHYPASDIPEQARRMYRTNWVRYIPDVHYKPVPLVPVVNENHNRLTDMTHCVLRSVSPIHCEYLHNMGVAASMSVSIMRDTHLWGLIACHHDSPRHLPYELRAACELLGQVVSIRIAALEDTEDCVYRSKTNTLQAQFLAELPKSKNIAAALVSQTPNLLAFLPASGAAVCFKGNVLTVGRTPNEDEIRLILDSTLHRVSAPVFVTDRLQDRVFEASEFVDTASGILCFTASRAHKFHVIWFRPEQLQVVKWGGEPTKPVEFDGTNLRLSPRRSFEVWKEEVRGKSQVWTQSEIEAAVELRATLMSLLLSKDDPAGLVASTGLI